MKSVRLLVLLAVLVPACGGPGEEEVEIRISVAAEPLLPATEYGQVVLFRFTFMNGSDLPLFIDRAETLEGFRTSLAELARPRHEGGGFLWAHSGLLLPGQELQIEAPYRVVAGMERILLTVRPMTRDDLFRRVRFLEDGEEHPATEERIDDYARRRHPVLHPNLGRLGRAVLLSPSDSRRKIPEIVLEVSMSCPERPFDPWGEGASGSAWTWSSALSGFVFRTGGGDTQLIREDGMTRLPTVPFEFLRDVDYLEAGPEVLGPHGSRRRVGAGDLPGFLEALRAAGKHVETGSDPLQPERFTYLIR